MAIIDGKLVSSVLREELKKNIARANEKYGKVFKLTVIIAGNDPASEIYVRNKEKACLSVGIVSDTIKLPENVTNEELQKVVSAAANDETVDGILVQLPLPKGLDETAALALIPPEKDVDGFSEVNIGRLTQFKKGSSRACTPAGMMKLLDYYGVELEGKHAVVVGRSNIVGKPMALMLLERNCTVTICHSKTKDLQKYTKEADILVCAAGRKHLITADMVKEGAVVLDAGINRGEDKKIYGDVDFDAVCDKVDLITPVPGGVGPMTITTLLLNTYEAGLRKIKNA
ncbi:MAG: bifunctional methylenetetrahydrofolate dehydrogenase/methenyltetrahydrofolate cyclohydrolase FolD [Candidatus Borkfalkiaceae bacterium]|nr:bifunctional methylenetetrahydrofolate dehydrogenase/methenyltetrahydrofolate cyclohydrolase FolD [Eubacteriales bacterium]MDY5820334.1 bifunctional methylenetetrahydrofolate dehydrogenase/methenyltetrahydrofolate cyclohydrolase FolD [Christensenellaceae bacterium]